MNIPVEKPRLIKGSTIETLLDDPSWGMAEKQDGNRIVLKGDGEGNQWLINKLGQTQMISKINHKPLQLKAAKALLYIGVPYIFDGEAIGGRNRWRQYVIFNVISYNGVSSTEARQIDREEFLMQFAHSFGLPYTREPMLCPKSPLVILKTKTDPIRKREFYNELKARIPVSEGVIFRDMHAQMSDENRGQVFKAPFIQELDAVAYRWHGGSTGGPGRGGSVSIGLYHNGELKSIGRLRSGLSYSRLDHMKEYLEAGKLVVMRVRFLGKRTIGIHLNQPRCREVRDDKLLVECTSDQLIDLLGPDRRIKFDQAKSIWR